MKRVQIAVAAFIGIVALMGAVSQARAEDKWVNLGTRTVDFKGDKDTIEVGKSEGHFTHIRIKVEDGDMVMSKIKVTFANGDTFEPDTKAEFKEGSRSRDIELPEKQHGRMITKVEFVYHSEHKHEKAVVVLYGKEK